MTYPRVNLLRFMKKCLAVNIAWVSRYISLCIISKASFSQFHHVFSLYEIHWKDSMVVILELR